MADFDQEEFAYDNRLDSERHKKPFERIRAPQENFSYNEESQPTYRKYNHNIAYNNRINRYNHHGNSGEGFNRTQSNRFHTQSRTFKPADYNKTMSFREFILNQDDKITPQEAVNKYDEYSKEQRKKQFPLLFEKICKLEWFRLKYHPYYFIKYKISLIRRVRLRNKVFNHLSTTGLFNPVFLDNNCRVTTQLIDVINYFLEGNNSPNVIDRFLALCPEVTSVSKKAVKRKHDESSGFDLNEDTTSDSFADLRNVSIHIDNIPKETTKKSLYEKICHLEGFSRVSLVIPDDNNAKFLKAIVTFKPSIDPKVALQNVKQLEFLDTKANISVCYATSPVVRAVKGPWSCTPAALSHLKLLIKLISYLDEDLMVFSNRFPIVPDFNPSCEVVAASDGTKQADSDTESIESSDDTMFDATPIGAHNELLVKAQQLVDKHSLNKEASPTLCANILSLIDLLVLYLRIVHSFDFYSLTFYRQEHEKSLRVCGISVRHDSQGSEDNQTVNSDISAFESRTEAVLANGITSFPDKKDVEGQRNEVQEVEKFVEQNIFAHPKSVWACKICDKKFKGKNFVEKHIHNKHQQHLDNVKVNTICYNNFIGDHVTEEEEPTKISVPSMPSVTSFTPRLDMSKVAPKRKPLTHYNHLTEPDINAFDF